MMKNTHILIVEDENIVAKDIENTLKRMGYTVTGIASSGEEALKKVTNKQPDLVLMDIKLKGNMDGIEAAKQLRSNFNIPVVFLTSYSDEETLQRAKATEPYGFILKPFSEDDIHSTIEIAVYKHIIEKKLRESEEKYRTLVENLNIGVYRSTGGPHGQFIQANPAIAKIFGYSSVSEFMKITVSHLYTNPSEMKEFIKEIKKRGYVKGKELKLKKKNGTPLWGSVTARVLYNGNGGIKWIDGVIEDITEHKRLIDDKEKLITLLLQSQKMESIGRLAGGVAHYYNNLLTSIMGFSELVLYKIDDNSPIRKDIESIKKVVKEASTLSRQLLEFSQKRKIQLNFLNVNETIRRIKQMLQGLIGENIILTTALEPDLEYVKSDSDLIEQLIVNLAVNARDSMPEGGRLTIKTENVIIKENDCKSTPEKRPGKYICISISDTGVGIDKDTIHRMFEPFFSTKEVGKGLGLGLSVVYGIVKQHEGWLNVESEPKKGSTFKIFLPVSTKKTKEISDKNIFLEKYSGNGETVLVVEDEDVVRELATRVFRENGYVAFAACNATEAKEI
ncbi:response regulator, partial [candidate division WOR-3 bacterium]|nr:response regulator [candidate division WOR-3 bacterium]